MKVKVLGVVENMKMDNADNIEAKTEELGIPFLGEIRYDPKVEKAIGNEAKLLDTEIGRRIRELIDSTLC
jgi:ATP-binding protein involved in chromosome partitioning